MDTKPLPKNIEILLVEDSPADVLLTREAFEQNRIVNAIHVAEDGIQAMDFLNQRGAHASAPRPDLILLDLNLPRMNGREVLAEIKADPDLKTIPIVVLTTSGAEEDILKAYHLNANCYVVKPVGLDNFMKAMQCVGHFWFSVVALPSE